MFNNSFHSQTIPGRLHQEARLETKNAKVAIYLDEVDKEIIYETEGLVAAVFGGTQMRDKKTEAERVTEVVKLIAQNGGIIINGALGGTMELAAKVAPKNTVGVTTPILHAEENKFGVKAAVSEFVTRRAILTYSPITIGLPGSLGTYNEVIATLLEVREKRMFGVFAPQVFIHTWWDKYIQPAIKDGIIDRETLEKVNFFTEAPEIKTKLNLN